VRPLSLRERRLVAVAILIALIAAIWLGPVSYVIDGFLARADERDTLMTQYERNGRIVASIPLWRRQIQAQEREATQFTLASPTAPMAGQQLKQRLESEISVVGGLLRSSAIVDTAGPGRVGVRGEADLSMSQLNQLLSRLQNGQPYVVIEHLSVDASRALQTGHVAPMAVRIQLAAAYGKVEPR
jgi:hypothetical protein